MTLREDIVSSTTADWSREEVGLTEWVPSRQLLRVMRTHARLLEKGAPRRLLRPLVAAHRFWTAVTGTDIPLGTKIEGGLLMPHPHGIVIHPNATIGPNCLLMQGVTIGIGKGEGVPSIAGGVDIGAGACVLGPVTIGKHARIGANAVVTSDVPEYAVVMGVPGRTKRIREPTEL